jgi:hypothetical protein
VYGMLLRSMNLSNACRRPGALLDTTNEKGLSVRPGLPGLVSVCRALRCPAGLRAQWPHDRPQAFAFRLLCMAALYMC